MATLLSAESSNGAGSGASHTGPTTVHNQANNVWDGAVVEIEMADSDTTAEYQKTGAIFSQSDPAAKTIDAKGTYFLRAVVYKAGSSTSLTITTTQ